MLKHYNLPNADNISDGLRMVASVLSSTGDQLIEEFSLRNYLLFSLSPFSIRVSSFKPLRYRDFRGRQVRHIFNTSLFIVMKVDRAGLASGFAAAASLSCFCCRLRMKPPIAPPTDSGFESLSLG